MSEDLKPVPPLDWPEIFHQIKTRTPARIFVEPGAAYSTRMQLDLRRAHASAVDAVWKEFDLHEDLPTEIVAQWNLFQVASKAESKSQYLLRPDVGRKLSDNAKNLIERNCSKARELQIVIGDGLSSEAVTAQVPALLPLLVQQFQARGWSVGETFCVRFCRVGIINDIGDLLAPKVLILLIGERPGLATAESLSAYMSYRPRAGQTDADRNLISNIHLRGVGVEEAAERIANLAGRMMALKRSGSTVREETRKLLGSEEV
jgi:ethanolamine ammonia-lyase small subunit